MCGCVYVFVEAYVWLCDYECLRKKNRFRKLKYDALRRQIAQMHVRLNNNTRTTEHDAPGGR